MGCPSFDLDLHIAIWSLFPPNFIQSIEITEKLHLYHFFHIYYPIMCVVYNSLFLFCLEFLLQCLLTIPATNASEITFRSGEAYWCCAVLNVSKATPVSYSATLICFPTSFDQAWGISSETIVHQLGTLNVLHCSVHLNRNVGPSGLIVPVFRDGVLKCHFKHISSGTCL